jgi:hypothetical protein
VRTILLTCGVGANSAVHETFTAAPMVLSRCRVGKPTLFRSGCGLGAFPLGHLGSHQAPSPVAHPVSSYSRPGPFSSSRSGASVPIPVPTQVHNYQRIEQNLHPTPR